MQSIMHSRFKCLHHPTQCLQLLAVTVGSYILNVLGLIPDWSLGYPDDGFLQAHSPRIVPQAEASSFQILSYSLFTIPTTQCYNY
jgi:hypothetical protein